MDTNTKDLSGVTEKAAYDTATTRAFRYIYLKNKSKYPLPFHKYQLVFLDGDKNYKYSWNLELLTPEELDRLLLDAEALNEDETGKVKTEKEILGNIDVVEMRKLTNNIIKNRFK